MASRAAGTADTGPKYTKQSLVITLRIFYHISKGISVLIYIFFYESHLLRRRLVAGASTQAL